MTIYTLFTYIGLAALVLTAIRYFTQKPLNPFITYLQDFVGVLFIFSGFVKAVDPLGTSYKMNEYFHEFNMMFFDPFALPFSVIMIVLEFVLGVALLIGYRKLLTLWGLLLVIVFFTFLTGFTAYTGKVTDCGCFGDFIKLKPIQTFGKDVLLTAMILILFFKRKHIEPIISQQPGTIVVGLVTVLSTWYCFRNFYFNEPQFDFRPYKVGNYIPDLMTVPDSLKPIKDFVFVYKNKKNGQQKEFTVAALSNMNYDEWEYVDRKEIVIREGEQPKIANFRIDNENGEDISEDLLNNPDYAFWVVAYDLNKTDKEAFVEKINPLAAAAEKAGYKIFAVSSTKAEDFRHDIQAAYPFYTGDATFLKTMIRSSPGVMVVKKGTVVAKYHHKHLPAFDDIKSSVLN